MVGWMVGWVDGWMDGWMDAWMDRYGTSDLSDNDNVTEFMYAQVYCGSVVQHVLPRLESLPSPPSSLCHRASSSQADST